MKPNVVVNIGNIEMIIDVNIPYILYVFKVKVTFFNFFNNIYFENIYKQIIVKMLENNLNVDHQDYTITYYFHIHTEVKIIVYYYATNVVELIHVHMNIHV